MLGEVGSDNQSGLNQDAVRRRSGLGVLYLHLSENYLVDFRQSFDVPRPLETACIS